MNVDSEHLGAFEFMYKMLLLDALDEGSQGNYRQSVADVVTDSLSACWGFYIAERK